MSTWAVGSGRWLAFVGVGAGVASLAVRVLTPTAWGPWWLSAPAVAVEVIGLVAAAVFVRAAFARPRKATVATDHLDSVDVVVRAGAYASEEDLRATLVAASALGRRICVVDIGRREVIRRIAREHGAHVVDIARGDLNGLSAAAALSCADALLLLDAGDIPAPDTCDRLLVHLRAAGVGAVQAMTRVRPIDSPEIGPSRRHLREFDSTTLRRWLGDRGHALVTGSGSLVRTRLVAEARLGAVSPAIAHAELTAALLASHWSIVADSGSPLVATLPPRSNLEADERDAAAATAARHLVFGLHGALSPNRLGVRARLSLLAWSIRPLAALRRAVFLGLLVACLVAGRVPYAPSVVSLALALGSVAAIGCGLGLASVWTLRPGDRCLDSVRTLGATWRGVLSSDPGPGDADRVEAGISSVFAVSLLGIALAMRGLSDGVTRTLHELPDGTAVWLLLLTLWVLGVALDAQRVLGTGRGRRSVRVATRTHGRIVLDGVEERAVVTDLSARGAAVLTTATVLTGQRVVVALDDPAVSLRATVRHLSPANAGRSLLGLEFDALDGATADLLVRTVTVPDAVAALAPSDGQAPSDARARPNDLSWDVPRNGVRALALLAAAGAFASARTLTPAANGPGAIAVMVAAGTMAAAVAAGAVQRRPALRVVELPAAQHSESVDFAIR